MAAQTSESEDYLPSHPLPLNSNIRTIARHSFRRHCQVTALVTGQPLGPHHLQDRRLDKPLPLQSPNRYILITHSYLSLDVRSLRKTNVLFAGTSSPPRDLMAMRRTVPDTLKSVSPYIQLLLVPRQYLHHRHLQVCLLSVPVV